MQGIAFPDVARSLLLLWKAGNSLRFNLQKFEEILEGDVVAYVSRGSKDFDRVIGRSNLDRYPMAFLRRDSLRTTGDAPGKRISLLEEL